MDRDFAKVMMRHSDAIDLLLGAMMEIVRERAPEPLKTDMIAKLVDALNDIHLGVRYPITKAHPDLDRDYKQ